jgi:SP family arabinose:H+ symporter-like MFS transporter
MSYSVWQEKMTSISNDSTLSPRTQRDTRRMNWFVSIAAAVAGLLFGLDIGVISGALPFITDHFTLSSQLQEWVVSSMMLGAAIGALFNGWLSFRLGRKYSLMAGAVLFVAGSIGSAFAASVEVLLVARVVLGVAVGIASIPRRCTSRDGQRERARENDQYVSADGDPRHCAGVSFRYRL